MEVSALKPSAVPSLRGPAPLLRVQSDERLIVLVRRGQHAAFEALVARYQSRLLAFVRHMLGSREDAEDVLQEVFAAAFNAILADERPINVRPWLYRIARNRSLNHLRRASAIGVDSMDIHYAEQGISTAEKVLRRESFRQLIGDVHRLPETQRTALLLREIDALSYEQIAEAMDTTVPAVKSLLVRARISLAEAAEARKLSCEEARLELGEAAEGLLKTSPAVRRHVRDCERCRAFKRHLKDNNVALAAMLPIGPMLLLKKLVLTKLGSTAGAGGAHVAGAGSASAAAGAGAGMAGGAGATSGLVTAGASALATKAAAGLAVAAIVTAGTVEADHAASPAIHHRHAVAAVAALPRQAASEPVVTQSRAQPVTSAAPVKHASPAAKRKQAAETPAKAAAGPATTTSTTESATAAPTTTATTAKPPAVKPAGPPVTEVTTETTQLPSTATTSQPAPPASTTATAAPPPPATTTTTTTATPVPPAEAPAATTTTTTEAPPTPAPPASTTPEEDPAPAVAEASPPTG